MTMRQVLSFPRLWTPLGMGINNRVPRLLMVRSPGRSSSAMAAYTDSSHDVVESTAKPPQDVKPFSAIPGPKPLPVLGNLLEFRKNSTRMSQFLGECYEKYGEIFKLEMPGGNKFVYIANPNNMANVFRAEGKYPVRENNMSPNIQWINNKLKISTPIVFRNGEHWKEGRSTVSNQIKPSNVHSYVRGLNGVAIRFTDYLKSVRSEEKRIDDITLPLRRLVLEMSAKFIYNSDLHAFDAPSDETEGFIKAIRHSFDLLLRLIYEPPLYKLYPNKLYRDWKKTGEVTRMFSVKHAENAWKKIKSGEESKVQGLLEQWLREGKMTESEALTTSGDMFGAALDTTSNQAAFMLYFMAKNPEAQEKLYKEIQSVLGDRSELTAEDISKMPYLKGCMMESFRMRPTGEMNMRLLAEGTTLMGYNIPSETNVWYLNGVAGRSTTLFSNPKNFDPERWTRDKPNPFAILPFGFGPRNCYGRRFAELELKLILLQMTRNFVLETDLEDLKVESQFLCRPAEDLSLYLKDRHMQ